MKNCFLIAGSLACVLVIQLCLTLCDPMGCSPPGSSVHGILQERLLEWLAMPLSRRSSQLREKNLSAMQETQIRSLDWEDLLEKGMTSHSSTLAWRIPWTASLMGYSPWGFRGTWLSDEHFTSLLWHDSSTFKHFYLFKISFVGIELIYNVVLVSGVQQSDYVIHIFIHFQILYSYRLL